MTINKPTKCKECGEPLLDNGMVLECENHDFSTYEGKQHTYISYNVPGMTDEDRKEALDQV